MDQVVEAQKNVAKTLYDNVVREYGKDCIVEFFSAGSVAESAARLVEVDGSVSAKVGGAERAGVAWHRLRNVMAECGGRGAWFSATARVTTDGRYSFHFDYDNEPSWRLRPLEETYLADLENFPRPLDQIPTWHPGHPSRRPV
ncbi:hypothetical protein [Prescottella agglutinans]|uniref:hypothetical protein n=1 Tax=Prescottella agglutinans TaxID=1644129 RepID=UPI003D966FD8